MAHEHDATHKEAEHAVGAATHEVAGAHAVHRDGATESEGDARSSGEETGAIDRRRFVRMAAVSGAAVVALGGITTACTRDPAHGNERDAHRATPDAPPEFELDEATIVQLQEGMRSGKYTAHSITQLYLDRIAAMDRAGPTLRAVIETNPQALEIAAALDAERKAGKVRGPLHGIPVLLKDNIGTADRTTTTAGSYALQGSIPAADAPVAAKLRAAGAVLLGKANLSEWANFRSSRSSSGWSGRGGQCRNPYALDRSPCGSSSGSGAAVAANFCTVAIGTETDGSIVCPSSANGIVGIKPTVGLVSRTGIVPISHTQDTAGPMARTVADAAALLSALTGVDAADPATADSRSHAEADYTRFLDANGLRGARIGVARKRFFGFDPNVDRLAEEAIAAMKSAGAIIVDPADIETAGEFDDSEFQVLLFDFKNDMNAYLASLGARAPARTLADLIAYNDAHRDQEMPYFGQETFLQAQKKGPLTSDEYTKALAKCRKMARTDGIDATMTKHKLDAIIAPTGGPAWTIDLLNGDHFTGGSSTPAAVAGYPNINVPMGLIHGMPVGLSFFGRAWSEPTLIRIAYAFEQATKHRAPPRFLPTANLT
ncbi:MAG TPA: amidase [Gemmatimonadaceae bacterium]|nr:amidase [Gemmatimonadaceae bacterium]